MDYYNDQSFQAYIGGMIASSPADESFASHEYDGVPAAEVSYDRALAAEANGGYLYDEVGYGVSYEEDTPSDEGLPVATAGAGSKKKKGKKRKRDPNKPKGWISAVLMYSNAHRARVKVENPGFTFGDIVSVFCFFPFCCILNFINLTRIPPMLHTGPPALCGMQSALPRRQGILGEGVCR